MPPTYALALEVLLESELPVELYVEIGRVHIVWENCSVGLNGQLVFCLLVVQMEGNFNIYPIESITLLIPCRDVTLATAAWN